jgi:hypothetical protein
MAIAPLTISLKRHSRPQTTSVTRQAQGSSRGGWSGGVSFVDYCVFLGLAALNPVQGLYLLTGKSTSDGHG